MSLWHAQSTTAQRFMWLIGDVCEMAPHAVALSLPFLFEMRDSKPFPGMQRSVAKWLWLTGVPEEISSAATRQLLEWWSDPMTSIGCKSYSAKALYELARQGRISVDELMPIIQQECDSPNAAYASRMTSLQKSSCSWSLISGTRRSRRRIGDCAVPPRCRSCGVWNFPEHSMGPGVLSGTTPMR